MAWWNELADVEFWRALIVAIISNIVIIVIFVIQIRNEGKKQQEDRAREAEKYREEREKEISLRNENSQKELKNIKLNTMIISRPYLVLVTDNEIVNQPIYKLEIFALKDASNMSNDLATKTISFPLYNAGTSTANKVLANNYHRDNKNYIVGGFQDRKVVDSIITGDVHYFSISKSIPPEKYCNMILTIKYDKGFFQKYRSAVTFDIVYQDIYCNIMRQPVTVELNLQTDCISFYPKVEYLDDELNSLINRKP